MRLVIRCALIGVALLTAAPLLADDVTGAEHMICAPMHVQECRKDGCVGGPPWEFDIGPFIDVDLEKKLLASTSRDHSTEIKLIHRDGELIVVQAYEMGRAFSMVISTPSGFFTGSITVDDGAFTVFGACKVHGADE